MKWLTFLVFIILATSAYAEVDSVSSGVFRGSMRHIVTISPEDTVSNVAAGDYLSFRFADGSYLTKSGHEELDVYIRRFDFAKDIMFFDVGPEKYLEVVVGDEYVLDVNFDEVDDVVLSFDSLNRRGVFTMRDVNAVPEEEVPENLFEEPCDIFCYSNDDCSPAEKCVFAGTCDSECEVDERINPPPPEFTEPSVTEDPLEEKGVFSRFWDWLAGLF